jgi:hypothetical protein
MGNPLEDWGWKTTTADDAFTGTTYQISYQSFTGRYRVNGTDVERTRKFEPRGEETANTMSFQGEGIIAHLKLRDLQRLLS